MSPKSTHCPPNKLSVHERIAHRCNASCVTEFGGPVSDEMFTHHKERIIWEYFQVISMLIRNGTLTLCGVTGYTYLRSANDLLSIMIRVNNEENWINETYDPIQIVGAIMEHLRPNETEYHMMEE